MVDDNPQSLELLTHILLGFRVETISGCRSAAEARNLLGSTYDLFIIDGEMPGEDGLSLTQHIRQARSKPNFTAPIVVVSGHTPRDKVMRARDAGANMVIKKPIAPAVLLSRIEWLARTTRQFVSADAYNGPDRRFQHLPLPQGTEERRAAARALTSNPDRPMSQDDIDSLFG